MAIVTRRYAFIGPTTAQLVQFVTATAAVNTVFQGTVVDIDIDSAVGGAVAELDAFMAIRGFVFNAAALPPLTLTTLTGDGSDGDVVIAANTNLARDMYYNNLTVQNTFTLDPRGYRIFVKNLLTVDAGGGIRANGGGGGGGGGAGTGLPTANATIAGIGNNGGAGGVAIGTAGTNTTQVIQGYTGTGGAGGAGNAGAGGAGGTTTPQTANVQGNPRSLMQMILGGAVGGNTASRLGVGAGGGGGGGDGTAGGGGGGGAGAVHVVARRIVNNGAIEAIGGAGGTPGAGNRGGGGGGMGGLVLLAYQAFTGNAPSVAGGAGGGATGTGVVGASGGAGLYIPHLLL